MSLRFYNLYMADSELARPTSVMDDSALVRFNIRYRDGNGVTGYEIMMGCLRHPA